MWRSRSSSSRRSATRSRARGRRGSRAGAASCRSPTSAPISTTAEALYAADGGFGELLRGAAAAAQALDQAIRQRLAHLFALLDSIEAPLVVAIKQPAERPKVEAAAGRAQGAAPLAAHELAPAIGLVIGFNATDGD